MCFFFCFFQGNLFNKVDAYFSSFRRCNYPKVSSAGLVEIIQECGRYSRFVFFVTFFRNFRRSIVWKSLNFSGFGIFRVRGGKLAPYWSELPAVLACWWVLPPQLLVVLLMLFTLERQKLLDFYNFLQVIIYFLLSLSLS